MMYAVAPSGDRGVASPHLRDQGYTCPHCAAPVIAHCGRIVTWHWAHQVRDCDPWTEPESNWHLAWKQTAVTDRGADIEVTVAVGTETHRADIVLDGHTVVELQHGYLSSDDIATRERFYQAAGYHLRWIYDASRFEERLHFGRRGFWWKHGAKSMLTHTCPVYWHVHNELWQVKLGKVTVADLYTINERILGRIIKRGPIEERFPSYWDIAIDLERGGDLL